MHALFGVLNSTTYSDRIDDSELVRTVLSRSALAMLMTTPAVR